MGTVLATGGGIPLQELPHATVPGNRRLKFEVDHKSHDVTVKVIDGETDKVIRVLPPEELQRLHDNMRNATGNTNEVSIEAPLGFLFDERV
jgi:flagellar protein FlaG